MSKKILFSDFDGTLYINGTVNEQDRNAIRRWRADGNLFAMASGRDLNALKTHLIEENVEWDFLLCLNGAEAYDHCDRLLFETPIDIKILPGLYRSVVQDDGWANVCCGSRGERVRTPNCTLFNNDHVHYPETHLSSFTKFTQLSTAVADTVAANEVKIRVLQAYGDYVSAEVNGHCIDINARGVNKASGIEKLIQIACLSPENVYCAGDNFNDLCMLTSYQGYAMANGPQEVQNLVGKTVLSIADLIRNIPD